MSKKIYFENKELATLDKVYTKGAVDAKLAEEDARINRTAQELSSNIANVSNQLSADIENVSTDIATVAGNLENTSERLDAEILATKDLLDANLSAAIAQVDEDLANTSASLSGEIVSTKELLDANLASAIEQVEGDLTNTASNLSAAIEQVAGDLTNTAANLSNDITNTAANLSGEITNTASQLGEQIASTDSNVSNLSSRVGEDEQLISGLNESVNNISEVLAGKQDTLVSGTNIRTVNGESLLDTEAGDLLIEGVTDYNELDNKPIIEQDLEAIGFVPVKGTYYKHKDSGEEPVIEYNDFVANESIPADCNLHVDTTREADLLAWIGNQSMDTNNSGYFVLGADESTDTSLLLAAGVLPATVTGSENAFVIMIMAGVNTDNPIVTPIYSTIAFTPEETFPHFDQGFNSIDSDGNVKFNSYNFDVPITAINYARISTMFDGLDWNGTLFSWFIPAVKPYKDGSIYYFDGEAYHEIIGEGATEDAPILNADFYAEDFTPKTGRTYRQIGTSKYIPPIVHEQGSRSITIYLDLDKPIDEVLTALSGLEEDGIEPVSEEGGVKRWNMVGDEDGGGLHSISILHVDAEVEGMYCDTDFWQIGAFGGLIGIWNSAQYEFQVDPSVDPQTVPAGWHTNSQLMTDNKIVITGADCYVFNTKYWNPFASTQPIIQAAKNTIAQYTGTEFSPIVIEAKVDELISSKMDKENPTGNGAFSLNRYNGSSSALDIGNYSVAMGYNVSATNEASVAIGYNVSATGNYAFASGYSTIAKGDYSHTEGKNTSASGVHSHAEGSMTAASGGSSHTEGYQTNASSEASHAEGYGTNASGCYSHAEGDSTTASNIAAHAEGQYTNASGYYSHAEGANTSASGGYSHAEGNWAIASGEFSHAEGYETTASGYASHAEGWSTSADNSAAHAEGNNSTASGESSHAEGTNTRASGYASHTEGRNTSASGTRAHAEGNNTSASGECAHAEGSNTSASNTAAHAEGDNTSAFGCASHAEGSSTNASGNSSHAEGANTVASRYAAHVEGYNSRAFGEYSHAEGWSTSANSSAAHAEGVDTNASGYYTHAEGSSTIASNTAAHAEGSQTNASGEYSHAEGKITTASGYASHAEGSYTNASNNSSHAEGYNSNASGYASHAEGSSTDASGYYSHVEGEGTVASGQSAHAEGKNTIAASNYQHVFGANNIEDNQTTYVEIVGKGRNTSARANARTLDWSGNEWLSGNLTVGNYTTLVGQANSNISLNLPNSAGNLALTSEVTAKKPDGTHDLIDIGTNKLSTTYIPDYILGQLIYGGTVNANTASASLTTNAKSKLGTPRNSITLTNDTTAITGYAANEGIYYVVSTAGTFAGISYAVGDWLISTGSTWKKVDNTDEVTSVDGQTGALEVRVRSNNSDIVTVQIGNNNHSCTVNNVANASYATSAGSATNVALSDNGSSNATVKIKAGSSTGYSFTVNNVANASYATSAGSAANVNLSAAGTGTATINISAGTGTQASFTVNNVANASYASNVAWSNANTATNANVSFKVGNNTYTKTVDNVSNAGYANNAGAIYSYYGINNSSAGYKNICLVSSSEAPNTSMYDTDTIYFVY